MSASIFFSYSHADEDLRDTLQKHLSALKRQGFVNTWHDRCIKAGDEFDREISRYLDESDIILLLVSADFLASQYCYDIEMRRAMERHAEGTAQVIPVILRHCDWRDAPFGKLQAVPKDGRPIRAWPDIDEAFLDVVTSIKSALPQPEKAASRYAAPERKSAEDAMMSNAARSSNLRVRKQFNQADRDQFLEETFEFLASFFENSLSELDARYEEISTKFRRIDANKFTAVIYRDGEAVSRCKIVLGGILGNGISYSDNDQASDSSCNDNLSVETDDHYLYLKPLMPYSHNLDRDAHLSQDGAAEYYWSRLIGSVQ